MPSKFTENYNLNQWEPGDAVLHTDFNADNLKLDAALLGKLGQPEIIRTIESTGKNYSNIISFSKGSIGGWDAWTYVAFLVHYTDVDTSSARLKFSIYGAAEERGVSPLSLPGYLAVLLPMHDASRTAGAIIFADRFYSFSAGYSYQEINTVRIGVESGTPIYPSIWVFGGR